MVLLDNLIWMLILVAAFAALSYLSLTARKKLVFVIASAAVELGAVVLILFDKASVEELFLTVILFGAVSLMLNYFVKKADPSADSDGAR